MDKINSLYDSKYGCWLVNGVPYTSKIDALKIASRHPKNKLLYYYHNHVWENFDRNLLGKIPLPTLYKERAQQLRDSYSYLILHYSGGSDSHNILHTFLTNNIKLDEICIRWPAPLRDGKLHTPNPLDRSARNGASEWDYAIKPTLDYLAQNYPKIKINIVDYGSNLTDRLQSVTHISSRLRTYGITRGGLGCTAWHLDPKTESQMINLKLDSIGNIFGIEKPILYFKDNAFWCQFMDSVWETAVLPRSKLEDKVESFYWSPEFPILALEQAYQSALWFKINTEQQQLLTEQPAMTDSDYAKQFAEQGELHKKILYSHSWDPNKFQAGKPNLARSDWFFWLYESPELETLRTNWKTAMSQYTDGVTDQYLTATEVGVNFLKPIKTKLFRVLSLD